jgi:hypothetical protein
MLFLVVSTSRPERPSELAGARQWFWPWMEKYQASGVGRHVYARTGRGAGAMLDVEGNEDNEALQQMSNGARELLASQAAAASKGG